MGITDRDLRSLDDYLAAVREVYTGQHIHKGRLAAAVLAQEGQYLAGAHVQADVIIGYHASKGLGYISKFNSILRRYDPHLFRSVANSQKDFLQKSFCQFV